MSNPIAGPADDEPANAVISPRPTTPTAASTRTAVCFVMALLRLSPPTQFQPSAESGYYLIAERQGLRPRLTTRLIFELIGSTRPARRLCALTTPFFLLE
jgi:hypothetical protein